MRNSKSKDLTLIVLQRFGIGWAASDKVVNKRFDPYGTPMAMTPMAMLDPPRCSCESEDKSVADRETAMSGNLSEVWDLHQEDGNTYR